MPIIVQVETSLMMVQDLALVLKVLVTGKFFKLPSALFLDFSKRGRHE